MKLTQEQTSQIIDHLRGTTLSFNTVLQEVAGLTISQVDLDSLYAIDNNIGMCADCDWWCDTEELDNNGGICDDCKEYE